MTRRNVVQAVLAITVAAGAGFAFRRVFGASILVPVALTAALTGVAIAGGTSWSSYGRRHPVVGGLATALVALVVVACGFAFRAAPSASVASGVVEGVVDGWARILSSTLPVRDDPELRVVPIVGTWLASALAVAAVLRTSSPGLPLLPPLALFTLGLLLGVRGEGTSTEIVTPFLVSAAALFGVCAWSAGAAGTSATDPGDVDGAVPRARRRVGVIAVVVVAATVALAPALAAHDPVTADRPVYDPREHRDDPVRDQQVVNPLAAMRRELQSPRRVIFRAEAPPSRWRLVALDRYDALGWSSTAAYRPAGTPLPTGDERLGDDVVEQVVTLVDPLGPWLPAVSRPVEVRNVELRFHVESGTLISTRPDLRDVTYTVASRPPRVPAEVVAAGAAPARDEVELALPDGLPPVLDQVRIEATAGADRPFLRLRALEQWFRERTTFDIEAPAGHTPARVRQFFDTRRGTSEQTATAFALIARQIGVPTRVVVGFLPGDDLVNGAAREITNLHLHAWVEAHFDELGWVAFDPTPERPDLAPEVIDRLREIRSQETEVPDQSSEPQDVGGVGDAASGPGPGRAAASEGESGPNLVVLAAAGLVVISLAGAVGLRRWARRRRRTGRDPRARIAGAWDEVVDGLRARHVAVQRTMSASEVAAAAKPVLEDPVPLEELTDLVNAARYAPSDPPDDHDAARAWSAADEVTTALRASASVRDRVRRAADFRVLTRR